MDSELIQKIKLNGKNLIGWRTNRKIIVFSVDDYGSVRLDSKSARENLEKAGLKVQSLSRAFDLYDALETKNDLELLFNTLSSVKDKNDRHAVFTPFAVPCNIDFEKMSGTGFQKYYYELLPVTYRKLSTYQSDSYTGAWDLWREGIEKKLMVPQFHGREHINLKVFGELLEERSTQFMTILKNRCFARIPPNNHSTISTGAAFDFWALDENEVFEDIIEDGLNAFEKVYGFKAEHFNSPAGRENPMIHQALKKNGVKYIDTPLIKKEHQGKGKYRTKFNYTGKRNEIGQMFMVRNVVFEPAKGNENWAVSYALKQIEAAFRWKRPAIISSHRVNFSGHISEDNRKKGIDSLRKLLFNIVKIWPDVEFFSANELGDLIMSNINE